MGGVNEGHPHGVPKDWRFYTGPVVTEGNNPCASMTPCNRTVAMTYWGTIYADTAGNPATNTRVNIRNCHSYWLNRSTHAWNHFGPENNPTVENYPENFSGESSNANTRTESDGTLSVKLSSGKVSHFFGPYPRIEFPRAEFGGVVNYCEMRLIVDDSSLSDDRASAKIIGNIGGDFYPAARGAGIANNPGIGGGKYKYVLTAWRSFGMTTVSYETLIANPPPLRLAGDNP